MFLLTATAFAATAFKVRGNLVGTVSYKPVSASRARLAVNLVGELSHLGKAHTVFETVADFSGSVPVPVSTKTGTITASNGDRISFTQKWSATPLGRNRFRVTAVVRAVKGTGRFSKVTGSGTYRSTLDLNTGMAQAQIEGSLFR